MVVPILRQRDVEERQTGKGFLSLSQFLRDHLVCGNRREVEGGVTDILVINVLPRVKEPQSHTLLLTRTNANRVIKRCSPLGEAVGQGIDLQEVSPRIGRSVVIVVAFGIDIIYIYIYIYIISIPKATTMTTERPILGETS
mmetsp:Transcript_2475/g.4640  ORF Transcript_2475/g.4640 Transcript_2475/m.4640 type:complete len:141 (-) Transcript_2475:976-1398(-)